MLPVRYPALLENLRESDAVDTALIAVAPVATFTRRLKRRHHQTQTFLEGVGDVCSEITTLCRKLVNGGTSNLDCYECPPSRPRCAHHFGQGYLLKRATAQMRGLHAGSALRQQSHDRRIPRVRPRRPLNRRLRGHNELTQALGVGNRGSSACEFCVRDQQTHAVWLPDDLSAACRHNPVELVRKALQAAAQPFASNGCAQLGRIAISCRRPLHFCLASRNPLPSVRWNLRNRLGSTAGHYASHQSLRASTGLKRL